MRVTREAFHPEGGLPVLAQGQQAEQDTSTTEEKPSAVFAERLFCENIS